MDCYMEDVVKWSWSADTGLRYNVFDDDPHVVEKIEAHINIEKVKAGRNPFVEWDVHTPPQRAGEECVT